MRDAGLSDRGLSVYGPAPRASLVTWLRSLFRWRTIGDLGVWRYQQNEVTGRRRALRLASLHGPLHRQWLLGGPWEQTRPPPPGPSRRTPERDYDHAEAIEQKAERFERLIGEYRDA